MRKIVPQRSIKTKIFGVVLLSIFMITAVLGYLSFEFSKIRLLTMLGSSIRGIAATIANFIPQEDVSLILENSDKIRDKYMSGSSYSFSNVYEKKMGAQAAASDKTQDEAMRLYTKYTRLLSDIKVTNRIDSPINIYLLEEGRLKIVLTSDPVLLTGASYAIRSEAKMALADGAPRSSGIYKDKDGTWISAYAATPASGRILVEINYKVDSYVARLRWELTLIILICVVGFAVTVFISYKLVTALVSAIKKLDEAAKELEKEHYHMPIDVKSNDEIGHLAGTFELLRGSIREKIEELRLSLIREKRAHLESVVALTNAIEMRDPYTKQHVHRVEEYALLIAKAIHLPSALLDSLRYSCILHDIGKIYIEDSILQKVKLLPGDYEEIKKHSEKGAKIIEGIQFLTDVKDAVLYHQERYDGKGYPEGLKGKAIPLLARIVGAADAFDAMTTDRPYKKKISFKEAMDEIERNSGIQFDPEVCAALLKYRDKIEEIAKKHFERPDNNKTS